MLRWEDERYIRFYTRNTPQWRAMSWRARGLFGLIMREVDRAGVLDLGKLGPKGVAVAVEAPWVEIEAPLAELLENGCTVIAGTNLIIPNFLPAQEANQSDRARKQKSRELARAMAQMTIVTGCDSTMSHDVTADSQEDSQGYILNGEYSQEDSRDSKVTPRDSESHDVTELGHINGENVTRGHTRSHAVTPCLAVPGLAVPISPIVPQGGPPWVSRKWAEEVREVIAYRNERYNCATPLNSDEGRRVERRLRAGYSVEQCKLAVDGNRMDPWNQSKGAFAFVNIFGPNFEKFVTAAKAGAPAGPKLLICPKCRERSHDGDCMSDEVAV